MFGGKLMNVAYLKGKNCQFVPFLFFPGEGINS